jgi:hypothetical protein
VGFLAFRAFGAEEKKKWLENFQPLSGYFMRKL